MQENILNLPQYLRHLRQVSSEQVALAMTGEYTLSFLDEINQIYDPEGYRAAHDFHACIIDAVDQGDLICITRRQGYSGETTAALFHADVIWSWALAELSDNSPWYNATTQPPIQAASPPAGMPPASPDSSNTHQLLIAGLARLLINRSHGAYLYGKKPNISALARDAAAEVAYALPPDEDKTESFRKTLAASLNQLPSHLIQTEE